MTITRLSKVAGLAVFFLGCTLARANLGEERLVSSNYSAGAFTLASNGAVASIYVATNDFWGVRRAAQDLQSDIRRVTGVTPKLFTDPAQIAPGTILVGTLEKNPLLKERIDASRVAGKWESWIVQAAGNNLIIAGSDKRGAIYGIYDLSQQMGVSPWYWWADVPVRRQDAVFVKPGTRAEGPPTVKYRGIFLNDEAPDLTGWADEKFGGYNHKFYTNIFELLLRLRANYLWPAMWNNCFNEDDPLNPQLADAYGIVMGTSHVEPMMRADKEWNRLGFTAAQWNYEKNPEELRRFWREGIQRGKPYENVITIGMRGKIDTPMSESANIALLEKIVAAQRGIISDVMRTNAADVPQLWCLYKEVQEYYEKGMRVPDDVTLLWSDDNWGDLRRLPTLEERNRAGGAGIYYHLDYVGDPRNYKWLNSTPIPKIWEQMNMACQYGADRIWIVNVGHLHHVTFPTEFFLTMAWDPAAWPRERVPEFGRLWAEREFGPQHAAEIARLMANYTQYNARRKPELLDEDTYSLVNYREAERVEAQWESLVRQADAVRSRLPAEDQDAYYELIGHPVAACANLNNLYFTAARSRLFAAEGRAGANDLARAARRLFQNDAALSDYFNHTLAQGKWDHMMDQTHIGYTSWQQPPSNVMPPVGEVEVAPGAKLGVAVEGSTNGGLELPSFDVFTRERHYIDVFSRGQAPIHFTAEPTAPWIKLDPIPGENVMQGRLWVEIDWENAPAGEATGEVRISSPEADHPVSVKLSAFCPAQPRREELRGFVESGGCVSMEAAHYTSKADTTAARWQNIADYGRTLSSMAIFPPTAASVLPPAEAPALRYRMYVFDAGKAEVDLVIAPTLNFVPGRGLRFALSLDDQPPQVIDALAHNPRRDWEKSVADSVRTVRAEVKIDRPGYHTLTVRMVDPGVVLEKVVMNFGGAKASYLGPPESYHQ